MNYQLAPTLGPRKLRSLPRRPAALSSLLSVLVLSLVNPAAAQTPADNPDVEELDAFVPKTLIVDEHNKVTSIK